MLHEEERHINPVHTLISGSSFSLVAELGAGRPGLFPAGVGIFSLRHLVQIGSGAHPAFCEVGTGLLIRIYGLILS